MQHYWGAQAICERIGYRSPSRLPELIIRYRIPAYLRRHHSKHHLTVYYSNSEMLNKWEMVRAQQSREQLIERQKVRDEAKAEREKYGPRGIKKRPSPASSQ